MERCKIKSPTVMCFPTISGESCYLSFGHNTKFEYEIQGSMVKLFRKNMDFYINRQDFEKMFEIIQ